MKNCEKYKTVKERSDAYDEYCRKHSAEWFYIPSYAFTWLDSEAEEDAVDEVKPLPCPFCGGNTGTNLGQLLSGEVNHWVDCLNPKCMYRSANRASKEDAIAAHNRICKTAVEAQ